MLNRRRRTGLLELAAKPLVLSGAALIALEAARRIFRHTQLFCPSSEPAINWDPESYGIKRSRVDECWFETEDGELLHSWYCRAERPIASGIFCHGNTGNLTTSAEVIPHLLDSGINVLMFDYRGFGQSTGLPSLAGVVSDGICAARYHDKIRPKGIPSILYGFSLGGAIAAQVSRHYRFDGLILQSTFTNLRDLARYTWRRLPLHLVAGSVFDTHAVIRKLKIPLLILHGTHDEVAPCDMAHALYDACPSVKKIYTVQDGMHKDLYVRDADTLVWAVNRFATELRPNTHVELEEPSIAERLFDAALRLVRRPFRKPQAHQTL